MKKIIATVLAMVMALALCTVAFAAETTETVKKAGYSVADAQNTTITAVAADFTKTTKDNKVVTDSTGTTTTVYPAYYVIDGNEYWVCSDTCHEYKLLKDGKVVAYLTTVDLSAGVTDTATSFIEEKDDDDKVCGDYGEDVYVIDGKAYKVGGNGVALYKGAAVFYGNEVDPKVEHKFTTKTTYDAKGKIVSAICDNCKKSFTVVEAGKVPANYAGETDTDCLQGYVVLLGTTVAADNAVATSPKTFDAGIAMYVGMALTSVAGSAVVIGKKKEF